MHVVAEEAGGAPLQAARASRETVGVLLDFRHVVIGTDRHGTERPRMRVGHALVVHRDVEEARRAERLAGRLDFFQMPAERFLPLVDAEDRLKRRRSGERSRRVAHQRVVQAMANRSLERLMQDPAPTHAVERVAARDSSSATCLAVHCSTIEASRPRSCAT